MKKNIKKQRVFAMMSGGVDSSVAALLLKKRGYEVVGVFMRCYNLDGCAERDAEDARRVAEKLKIPFYVWDFEEEYKKKVVDYMIDGYRRGTTPNPDIMCNKEIKFGLFLKKALGIGADYIASGHYVRLRKSQIPNPKSQTNPKSKIQNPKKSRVSHFSLLAAKDKNKDQRYFLWTLTQEQLKHCLFPIGDYLKSEVREMARKAGLPTAEKKDSQGICFLGKVALDEFLGNYLPKERGDALNVAGEKIGEHKGAHFYTIGQRHLKISNIKHQKSKSLPIYVVEKNVKSNTLVVAEGSDNPALYKKEVELTDVNFINPKHSHILKNMRMLNVLMRVRYRQPLAKATLTFADSMQNNTDKFPRKSLPAGRQARLSASVHVLFEQVQKFVAPGQSAVFYGRNGEMLGGGIIV